MTWSEVNKHFCLLRPPGKNDLPLLCYLEDDQQSTTRFCQICNWSSKQDNQLCFDLRKRCHGAGNYNFVSHFALSLKIYSFEFSYSILVELWMNTPLIQVLQPFMILYPHSHRHTWFVTEVTVTSFNISPPQEWHQLSKPQLLALYTAVLLLLKIGQNLVVFLLTSPYT